MVDVPQWAKEILERVPASGVSQCFWAYCEAARELEKQAYVAVAEEIPTTLQNLIPQDDEHIVAPLVATYVTAFVWISAKGRGGVDTTRLEEFLGRDSGQAIPGVVIEILKDVREQALADAMESFLLSEQQHGKHVQDGQGKPFLGNVETAIAVWESLANRQYARVGVLSAQFVHANRQETLLGFARRVAELTQEQWVGK